MKLWDWRKYRRRWIKLQNGIIASYAGPFFITPTLDPKPMISNSQ